jgi:signal transduction histidine kinase
MHESSGEQETQTKARSRFGGAVALTLVSGLCLLLILGLVFSVTRGSQQTTTSANALHSADETLRAATVVRAQVGLATYMITVDDAFGTNSADAIDLSIGEARTAFDDMRRGVANLEEDGSSDVAPAVEATRTYAGVTDQALEAIAAGDVDRARSFSDLHDESFQTSRAELDDVRERLVRAVDASDDLLGRIGNVALFLVAFLVPAGVIFVYRQLLLRQNRQAELESRLESERRLNAAREEFIANASHELRTPLTGITGLAQLLVDEPSIVESETASELLNLIVAESHDLTRMVEDLLTTARLDAHALHFDFDDVAIDEVVAEVVDPLVRAGVEIKRDCEPAFVRADGLRTRQILRNLISNARKYGGSAIEVVGRIDGNTYRCDVIDDGDGMPDDLRDRMFERFVHRGGKTAVSDSVGLGLSIVHALVEGMGGSIGYRHAAGKTVFTARLPLSEHGETSAPAFPSDREDLVPRRTQLSARG